MRVKVYSSAFSSTTFIGPCLGLAFLFFTSCAPSRQPVPIGEVPPARSVTVEEEQYGHEVLSGLSEEFELDYNDPRLDNITKIVDRLTASIGASKEPWHVYLFRAPEVKNAAATRGNHVFVWSGLLDATKNDDELATILAHELAHVLAGHTDPNPNDQIRQIIVEIGALAAGVAVAHTTGSSGMGQNLGDITSGITRQLGSGILVNPYARDLEREADHVGLFLMADAGYDPNAAIQFWTRAQSDPAFGNGLEFFSTHPLAADRMIELQKLLPLAEERYRNRGKIKTKQVYVAPHQKKSAAKTEYVPASPPQKRGDSFDMRQR